MHVLVTADTVGGVWTYARELVTGFSRRGVRVTLVSFGEIPAFEQTEWIENLQNVDFRPTAFRLEWMQDCQADLELSAEYLKRVIEEVQPDLLHTNQYYYGALDIAIPRIMCAHSDVVSWWKAVHGKEPPSSGWMTWYRDMISHSAAMADMVIAPSLWMLRQFISIHGKPRFGSVVYNGRSASLFDPHLAKDDSVLSVGRIWDAGKNVSLLTLEPQAMSTFIVGSEKNPDPHGGQTPKAGGARIHYLGARNEAQLRQMYAQAAVYAATSRYEPFGLAPLEAALSRCALVVNDIPAFRELWDGAALFFERDDARSLAQALERLKLDSELRQTYANLAYQRARHRFSADRMVDDYMHLYTTLVPSEVVAA